MGYVEALRDSDIDFGKAIWHALRENKNFPAQGVLWLFQSESGEWHLLIATPKVDEVGPRKAYEELTLVTKRLAAGPTNLQRIELISPRVPLYQALRDIFGKTASVEGVRLGNTQVGGMYIDDAYLYETR